MMPGTPAAAPEPECGPAGRGGFARVLHAEWTKFRTVRGWVTAVLALALGTALRRGADAVTAVIAAIVLPYLLAVATPLLPA